MDLPELFWWMSDEDLELEKRFGYEVSLRSFPIPPDFGARVEEFLRFPAFYNEIYFNIYPFDISVRPYLYGSVRPERRSHLDRGDLARAWRRDVIEREMSALAGFSVRVPRHVHPRIFLLKSIGTYPWQTPLPTIPWNDFDGKALPSRGPGDRISTRLFGRLAKKGSKLLYFQTPKDVITYPLALPVEVTNLTPLSEYQRLEELTFEEQVNIRLDWTLMIGANGRVDVARINCIEKERGRLSVRTNMPLLTWPRDVSTAWIREMETVILADEQRLILAREFFGALFHVVNLAIVGGCGPVQENVKPRTVKIARALLGLLDDAPPLHRPLVLYRGITPSNVDKVFDNRCFQTLESLKPGDSYEESGFASKSYSARVAHDFMRDSICCLLEFRYPAGHRLLFAAEPLTFFPNEAEFVSRPGEIFRVADNKMVNYPLNDSPIRMVTLDYVGGKNPKELAARISALKVEPDVFGSEAFCAFNDAARGKNFREFVDKYSAPNVYFQ